MTKKEYKNNIRARQGQLGDKARYLQMLKVMKYSDEILSVIDQKDEMTRGDFQGVIEAIVLKILTENRP